MENKKFTKADLKAGYIVKYRNGDLRMVMPAEDRLVFVSENGHWLENDDFNSDLTANDVKFCSTYVSAYDVVAVYGLTRYANSVLHINTSGRELLWKREEAKKMTVEEIEKELGYKIEIVSE